MELLKTTLHLLNPQIAVFSPPSMTNPFNDWDDRHVAQGFAWRTQSVSFATLEEYGALELHVVLARSYEPDTEAIRIIRVPFRVEDNVVAISNLVSDATVSIPNGNYELIYETGYQSQQTVDQARQTLWCRLIFLPTKRRCIAQIIRADSKLSPGPSLLMEARPAASG